MLLLLELDVCIINLVMLQEHHGIHLTYQGPKQYYQGADQGEWDLDFLKY